ncbi:hypothetical protein Ahy_A03g011584 [Arachis hypogaea]|uniref:Uncharacterized protein n=1 Tax=Arachis hypogaea TaxID=3818 RepID=A0A445DR55_ARAHY|nr:hypothetical protein Ahy_A03g011584 [Arachis hypogaea]
MEHSFTSPSHSKKTQPFHFRATLQTAEIAIVAKIRTLYQHNIELSIKNLQKKQSYNTQETMADGNQAEKNQTKDLKCATHLLSEKFRNMSEEKKIIVRDLGFGGLMHIPPLRVHHQIIRELANSFKLGENRLETGYDSFKVTQKNKGCTWHQCVRKSIIRIFLKMTNKFLEDSRAPHVQEDFHPLYTDDVPVTNDNKQNLTCAPDPNFQDGHNNRAELGRTCFEFYHKGITDYKVKKKKAIDGCLFALMIIYFHLSKNKDKKRAERPPEPWIANWSKEQLIERMRAEMEDHMVSEQNILGVFYLPECC